MAFGPLRVRVLRSRGASRLVLKFTPSRGQVCWKPCYAVAKMETKRLGDRTLGQQELRLGLELSLCVESVDASTATSEGGANEGTTRHEIC